MGLLQLVLGVAGDVVPVAVDGQHQLAVVVRPVELGVVVRGVPGLVGVPRVDVEEEVLLVVTLHPLHRGHEGAGSATVRLVPPRLPDVQGLVVVAGHRDERPHGVLAAVHVEGLKPPVIVHPTAHVVGRVHGSGRVVAAVGQHLGDGGHVRGQRLPAHEGHGPAPGEVVGPGGHGGESGGIVAVEPDGSGGKRVQRGRLDPRISVRADVIPAKGVSNDPDDVHFGCG